MIKHGSKGLYSFIDEVRCCKTKEEEETKLLQELVKIKKSISDKNITNYKRKNNIWKLIYCHILGYGISVSYFDIIKLVSSTKYSEKYCGYTALSLLLDENNEVLNMFVSTIKEDIKCKDEHINALALNFICHKINDLIIENLYEDILQIVTFNYVYKPYIRKKAFLCISNIYKKRHDLLLKKKGDVHILKFLDQNLNEINFSNVFSYLNLIYITTLILQKYEKMYNYKKEEEKRNKRKRRNEEYDLDLCKREYMRSYDNNNSYLNNNRRINIHIKEDITKKNKGCLFSKESNFFYDDIKKVDRFLEIESDCSINYEEVNYEELKKYVYKYIQYILKIMYYIINENYKSDRGTFYNNRRHPFLLIKCLQMLQLFDVETLPTPIINNINEILYKIIYEPYKRLQGRENEEGEIPHQHNEEYKTIFRKNFGRNAVGNKGGKNSKIMKNDKSALYTEYGIIYECFNLLHFLKHKAEDRNRDILICLLMSSLDSKKSNIIYVVLNTLSKLKLNVKIHRMIESHIMHIIHLLNNDDLTIKLQTFNILFNMCNRENWKLLINVFLHHLPNIDAFIQNEIIIKITILSEYFSPDLSWYIDIVFKIIEIMHKSIIPEVWFRLVQIVTGFVENEAEDDEEEGEGTEKNDAVNKKKDTKEVRDKRRIVKERTVQRYAALKCYNYLSKNITNIELLIDLCSYLIGSFGYLIKDKITIREQFNVLEKYISFVSANTKCIILMAMTKLVFYDNSIVNSVKRILSECRNSVNLELQTRSCEFLNLLKLNNFGMLSHLLKHMPLYDTKKIHENFLIKRLLETNKHAIIDFNDRDDLLLSEKNDFSYLEKGRNKQVGQRERHNRSSREKEEPKDTKTGRKNERDIDTDDLKNHISSSYSSCSESDSKKSRKEVNKKNKKGYKDNSTRYSSKPKNTQNSYSVSESSHSFKSTKSLEGRQRSVEADEASNANHSSESNWSKSNETSRQDELLHSDESDDSGEESEKSSNTRSGSSGSSGSSRSSGSSKSNGSNGSSGGSADSRRLFKLLCLQKANNANDLWLNACLLNKCVFVKNNFVSVLIKQKYLENKGIIILYIKNISPKPIKLASINVEKCNNIHVKAQKVVIEEKLDTEDVYSHKLLISVTNIFYKIPDVAFNIITSTGTPTSFTCKLPILITRFIKENKMNEEAFKNYWKMITQVNNEDIKMGIPKFSKKYFLNYLINVFNLYTLKIGMFICAAGYLDLPDCDKDNKILIFVKIRYKIKGCHISVVTNVKHLNSYLNKIFEIYLIKNK